MIPTAHETGGLTLVCGHDALAIGPDPKQFAYTFEHCAQIMNRFTEALGISRYTLYMQDYGGPIGNRILGRHPGWLEWLIIQNANCYEEGFTDAWEGLRHALWVNRSAQTEAPLEAFLSPDGVRTIYLHGHRDPKRMSPDAWNMDLAFLARPYAHRAHDRSAAAWAYSLPSA